MLENEKKVGVILPVKAKQPKQNVVTRNIYIKTLMCKYIVGKKGKLEHKGVVAQGRQLQGANFDSGLFLKEAFFPTMDVVYFTTPLNKK